MPGFPHLNTPGVLHHIMIRGIEHRKIFLNSKDYENFLERPAVSSSGDEGVGKMWRTCSATLKKPFAVLGIKVNRAASALESTRCCGPF
jgi:hypothetical protein